MSVVCLRLWCLHPLLVLLTASASAAAQPVDRPAASRPAPLPARKAPSAEANVKLSSAQRGPIATAPSRPPTAQEQAANVLARFAAEPSVEAVQEAAASFAGTDPRRVAGWRSRVRLAPWLPELRARVLRGVQEDGLTNANGQTRAQSDDLAFEVQARWRFDRLVFDRNELAVSREGSQLADLRRERVAEATRLYFARRRLQVEMALESPKTARERIAHALTLDELTAELDGLTGGFFRRASRREK